MRIFPKRENPYTQIVSIWVYPALKLTAAHMRVLRPSISYWALRFATTTHFVRAKSCTLWKPRRGISPPLPKPSWLRFQSRKPVLTDKMAFWQNGILSLGFSLPYDQVSLGWTNPFHSIGFPTNVSPLEHSLSWNIKRLLFHTKTQIRVIIFYY